LCRLFGTVFCGAFSSNVFVRTPHVKVVLIHSTQLFRAAFGRRRASNEAKDDELHLLLSRANRKDQLPTKTVLLNAAYTVGDSESPSVVCTCLSEIKQSETWRAKESSVANQYTCVSVKACGFRFESVNFLAKGELRSSESNHLS
jgi:hypothetical protein